MKLYNPSDSLIALRDEINHTRIILHPKGIIDVQPHLVQSFSKYVRPLGLQWLLDDVDLPAHARIKSEDIQGTHANFRKTEKGFDAQKAMEQSDATEIAEIWHEHDPVTYVPHETTVSAKDNADFLFLKEDTSVTKEETAASISTPEEFPSVSTAESIPSVSDEGPDYLRNVSAPEELEEFGATLLTQDDDLFAGMGEGEEDEHEHELLPDSAPVTISQLRLSTKAALWEMGDKLGIDTTGTKQEIIQKLCKYHWKAHQLRLQMMQNT
jgi:hypothetical protein